MQDIQAATWSDTELLGAVAAGNRQALAALYDRHASAVYGMALSMLRDQALAQDVSQETFVRLWTRAQTFDPARGTALGWLLSVTRNLVLDEVRRQRRRTERVARLAREADQHPATGADLLLNLGWESQRVLDALAELSVLQRETVELAYVHGYTLVEIAARLNVAVGTVKSRLHSALLSLRASLAETARAAGSASGPPMES